MKLKHFLILIGMILALGGCSIASSSPEDSADSPDGVSIGGCLKIKNTNERLKLLNHKDELSANGLYYASWSMGDATDYENSDGQTIDLYDAQLYLLLAESKNSKNAQENMDEWMKTGKKNYDITGEEEFTCNGQTYSLITYNCKSADNPYDRGISAFGIYENNAVCIELTCRDTFEEDLKNLLTGFLNDCHYGTD